MFIISLSRQFFNPKGKQKGMVLELNSNKNYPWFWINYLGVGLPLVPLCIECVLTNLF